MLGKWMQYTCAYWKDADNLDDAQVHKMELIAKKLDLKPGMRVLDIGCGWGTLCKYLAENYKVECVGVSIGKEGVKYAKEILSYEQEKFMPIKGLPVEIRLQDYREVNEQFDRVVCVEMLEHVGRHNYPEYFNVVNRCLKEDGIFLLHVIGRNHVNYPFGSDPWMQKHLFPNIYSPDPEQIIKATKGLFIIEDWHNFGPDFAKTLLAWRENFVKGWPQLEDKKKYDERFYRMWMFYLSSSIGLVRSRRVQLWQIVFSKDGLKREYRAAR